jgi:hypothetical protein
MYVYIEQFRSNLTERVRLYPFYFHYIMLPFERICNYVMLKLSMYEFFHVHRRMAIKRKADSQGMKKLLRARRLQSHFNRV